MKENNENNISINTSVLNESSYPLTDKKNLHTKRSSAFELLLESHKDKEKNNLNNSSNMNLLREKSFSGSIDEIMSKNKEEDLKEKLKFESKNSSSIKNSNSSLRNASSLKSSSSSHTESSIIEDKYEKENRILKKVEKIENSDSENEASDEEVHIKFMIKQDNKYLYYWELIITSFVLLSCFITPYSIAFNNVKDTSVFEISCIIVCLIDIIANFFTNGQKNITFKENLYEYLTSWFIIDFCGVFPFGLIINETETQKILLFNLPKLFRAFKLIQDNRNVEKCLRNLIEKFKLGINFQRCFLLLFSFAFSNHICACLFYYLARINNFDPTTWVSHLNLIDRSEIDLYYISLYWTLTTVTTVGYGNISGYSWLEKIYSIIIISIGVVIYSFFIGTLSVIVSTINQKQHELDEKLEYIDHIQRNYDIDKTTYEKVKRAIKFDTNRAQLETKKLMKELPNKLRLELSQVINDKTIKNFIFFRGQTDEFYGSVAPLLKPFVFYQNDYMYQPKDIIQDMYLIGKGTVIYCMPKEYNEKEVRTLKKNWNFGEIEMCTGQAINYSIKIKSRVAELYTLKKLDFVHLTVTFQDAVSEFLEKSLILYKEFKERYYRTIKESNELNLRVSRTFGRSQSIEEHSNDEKKNIKDNNNINEKEAYNASEENSDDEDKKKKDLKRFNGKNKRKISAATLETINLLKNEDMKINKEIDSLIQLMKDNNITFPEEDIKNPYNLLMELKKETNMENKVATLNQIEEMIKGYFEN